MIDWTSKLAEYEPLVKSTVRYWRPYITSDMSDEDIAQELRMKVWRALQTFDPSRGYPEKKHVFGALRNKVKDLMAKKHRENFETLTSMFHEDNVKRETDDQVSMTVSYCSSRTERESFMQGMTVRQQQISVLIIQGYNHEEISREIGESKTIVKSEVSAIRSVMRPASGSRS